MFGIVIGKMQLGMKVVEVTDTLKKADHARSDYMRKKDAVMQLQDEIINSGALQVKHLPNGDWGVSLKVVK